MEIQHLLFLPFFPFSFLHPCPFFPFTSQLFRFIPRFFYIFFFFPFLRPSFPFFVFSSSFPFYLPVCSPFFPPSISRTFEREERGQFHGAVDLTPLNEGRSVVVQVPERVCTLASDRWTRNERNGRGSGQETVRFALCKTTRRRPRGPIEPSSPRDRSSVRSAVTPRGAFSRLRSFASCKIVTYKWDPGISGAIPSFVRLGRTANISIVLARESSRIGERTILDRRCGIVRCISSLTGMREWERWWSGDKVNSAATSASCADLLSIYTLLAYVWRDTWSLRYWRCEILEKEENDQSSFLCHIFVIGPTVYEMEADTTSNILLMSKIGAMIGLGFGSLALGTLPLIVGRYRAKRRLRQKRRAISSNHSSTSTSTSTSNASSTDSASVANKQVRPRNSQKSSIVPNISYTSAALRKTRLCASRKSNRLAGDDFELTLRSLRGHIRRKIMDNQGYSVPDIDILAYLLNLRCI